MSSSPARGAKFWIVTWLPVALGIGVIVAESTSFFGADQTSGPLRIAFQALFGPVTDAQWDPIHHVIRKCGHFVGYGTLGLTWLRAWWLMLRGSSFWICALLGLAGTTLVASLDEWHQTFLPNRTGRFMDVVLDSSGAVTAILLTRLLVWIYEGDKRRRALWSLGPES